MSKFRTSRQGDMNCGVLRLTQQEDGDVIVAIEGNDPLTGKPAYATVEFCSPGRGGGRSHRTHAALQALITSMQQDNLLNKGDAS